MKLFKKAFSRIAKYVVHQSMKFNYKANADSCFALGKSWARYLAVGHPDGGLFKGFLSHQTNVGVVPST